MVNDLANRSNLSPLPVRLGITSEVLASGNVELLAPHDPKCAITRQRIIDLYDGLRPPLHAYLCSLGVTADQAEDVIQETFLRLVRCRLEQSKDENLRSWVFRVAHNLSMDVHRFQRRWSQSKSEQIQTVLQNPTDPGPTPEQHVIQEERMKRFEDAFAQLTPKQRQCVLLRAEGFRYREIAHTLGVSVQRVGELMQRSITLLEDFI
jgi:RNA polymerase sigma-70 factor (ECF subfamily)